jgi:hypothetical protein
MALVSNILMDHHDCMIYITHNQPSSHMLIYIHPLLSHKYIQVIFVLKFSCFYNIALQSLACYPTNMSFQN